MQNTNVRPATIEEAPACLKVPEVAAILGISRARAYELANSTGFPRIPVGKRIVIPKNAFMDWMEANTVTETVR